MKHKATTPAEYLADLPPERRAVISKLRTLIKKNLPKGYVEGVDYGSISYAVPLKRLPKTYNGKPLMYLALAAQKNHYALYIMCNYMNPKGRKEFEAGFKKAGKKLDMGKSCVRFQKLDDLPLEVIAKTIASVPMETYASRYEAMVAKRK